MIGLATSGIGCGSEDMSSPPGGHGVLISGFTYVTGADSVQVSVFENKSGNYSSKGSSGSLDITDVTDATVSASVDFDYTNDDNETFSAHGDFVIVHCP